MYITANLGTLNTVITFTTSVIKGHGRCVHVDDVNINNNVNITDNVNSNVNDDANANANANANVNVNANVSKLFPLKPARPANVSIGDNVNSRISSCVR